MKAHVGADAKRCRSGRSSYYLEMIAAMLLGMGTLYPL